MINLGWRQKGELMERKEVNKEVSEGETLNQQEVEGRKIDKKIIKCQPNLGGMEKRKLMREKIMRVNI